MSTKAAAIASTLAVALIGCGGAPTNANDAADVQATDLRGDSGAGAAPAEAEPVAREVSGASALDAVPVAEVVAGDGPDSDIDGEAQVPERSPVAGDGEAPDPPSGQDALIARGGER